ncbi:hypothetical protein PCANB_002474 [Pneumocystis canis]|nr:hypothetical protein PCK1_002485 [Pneumocystis canis]KAG5438754.1 hypothetical protein PCANB_002474 [Pneumocystis canis]
MAFLRIHKEPSDLIDLTEHQSATPNTFSLRVLHFFSKNATFKTFPTIDLSGQQIDVYITSENFILFSPVLSSGLEIPYQKMILHAIYQTPYSAFDAPCIYIQIEDLGALLKKDSIDNDSFELSTNTVELYILPSDPSTLNNFFEALSHCSSLHPCSNQESEDDTNDFNLEHNWTMKANSNSESPIFTGKIHEREEEQTDAAKWRRIN